MSIGDVPTDGPAAMWVDVAGGQARVVLAGCLDTFIVVNAFSVRDVLQLDTVAEVTIDAAAVTYIDSAVLATLVAWAKIVRAHHGTFTVGSASVPVKRLCALTGLDGHLERVPPSAPPERS